MTEETDSPVHTGNERDQLPDATHVIVAANEGLKPLLQAGVAGWPANAVPVQPEEPFAMTGQMQGMLAELKQLL